MYICICIYIYIYIYTYIYSAARRRRGAAEAFGPYLEPEQQDHPQ